MLTLFALVLQAAGEGAGLAGVGGQCGQVARAAEAHARGATRWPAPGRGGAPGRRAAPGDPPPRVGGTSQEGTRLLSS